MLRLSSNLTLFLKLFVPVFWTTILTGLALVAWFAPEQYFAGVPLQSLRYGIIFVLLTWLAVVFVFFWPLKRVETDGNYLYVTNYFTTARYHLVDDVKHFQEGRFFFRFCTVELKGKGAFGRSFRFVTSGQRYRNFRAEYAGAVSFT